MSEFLFYIIIFLANIIQGITGFAGTILAMPFSIHLVGYEVAKPVLNVLGIIAGIYVVAGGIKNVNTRQLIRVAVMMAVGIVGGIFIKDFFTGHERVLYIALGIFVVAIGLKGIVTAAVEAKNNKRAVAMSGEEKSKGQITGQTQFFQMKAGADDKMTPASVLLLLCAGVVHGIFVCGGPLIISYMTGHTKDKEEFRRTISAVWIILNTMIFVSDIMAGYYNPATIRIQLISVPFLFAGMFFGGILFKKMSQRFFTILTYILLCIAGASLLFK